MTTTRALAIVTRAEGIARMRRNLAMADAARHTRRAIARGAYSDNVAALARMVARHA